MESRSSTRGFTLIELLVTLAILAILLKLVAPSFASAFLSNKLTAYSNSFAASVQLARGEAVKRNAAVTLCRSSDGATCTGTAGWEQGWVVRAADGTVIHTQDALSSDYLFASKASDFTTAATVYSIVFQPSGIGATEAYLLLCRATPSAGNQERQIHVFTTGRTTVTKSTTGTCA
jgi:type IV fimbrial biogenesis protein FimT